MFCRTLSLTTIAVLGLQLANAVVAAPAPELGNKEPVQIQFSLISKNTFSQGEPIVLKYKIANTSTERVSVYTSGDDASWLHEAITDPQGHTFGTEREQVEHLRGGSHFTEMSLPPRSFKTGYIVCEMEMGLRTPGTYVLTLHTRLPYASGSQAESLAPNKYEALGNINANDFKFLLNVTPYNALALKQAAESLRNGIERLGTHDWSAAAVKALFSLPEVDALSSWQELISEPTTSRFVLSSAVEQLAHIHSVAAADLIAQMLWEPAQPADTDQMAVCCMIALDKIAKDGNLAVKKHIMNLYKAHGQEQKYSLEIMD